MKALCKCKKLCYQKKFCKLFLALSISVGVLDAHASHNTPASPNSPENEEKELLQPLPAEWSYQTEYNTCMPSEDRWWQEFDDPVLTKLIREGEENSLDLAQALRRINMAKQNWEMAKAAYYPTLGLQAGWTKARGSGMTGPESFHPTADSYFSLGLNFSWEIDIFGKVYSQSKAQKASYNATKAEYTSAMVALSANIATAYFNYRAAQARIEVAKRQINSQERIRAITEARHEAGLASKLDVAQALTVLYSTQATLPALESLRTSALNSLATLIGCYPEKIRPCLLEVTDLPIAFRIINMGVPAELLRRRPDILEAESQLALYAAQIGMAKKDFLPTLSLNGSIGTSSRNIKDLFKNDSFTYSIAPKLSWTIFEGFSRTHKLAYAKEQMMAGIDNYNLTVMNAVIETETAFDSYYSQLQQITLVRKVLAESKEAFSLALDRYKRGLSAFNDVMDAQINVLTYENQLLETRASALGALVKVYAAVAGAPETTTID